MMGCGQCRPPGLDNASRCPHCPQPLQRRQRPDNDGVGHFSMIKWDPFQLSKFRPICSSGIFFDDQMGSFSFDKNIRPRRRHLRTVHLDQPVCSALSRSVCPTSDNSPISTRSSMVVVLPIAILLLREKHGTQNGFCQIHGTLVLYPVPVGPGQVLTSTGYDFTALQGHD